MDHGVEMNSQEISAKHPEGYAPSAVAETKWGIYTPFCQKLVSEMEKNTNELCASTMKTDKYINTLFYCFYFAYYSSLFIWKFNKAVIMIIKDELEKVEKNPKQKLLSAFIDKNGNNFNTKHTEFSDSDLSQFRRYFRCVDMNDLAKYIYETLPAKGIDIENCASFLIAVIAHLSIDKRTDFDNMMLTAGNEMEKLLNMDGMHYYFFQIIILIVRKKCMLDLKNTQFDEIDKQFNHIVKTWNDKMSQPEKNTQESTSLSDKETNSEWTLSEFIDTYVVKKLIKGFTQVYTLIGEKTSARICKIIKDFSYTLDECVRICLMKSFSINVTILMRKMRLFIFIVACWWFDCYYEEKTYTNTFQYCILCREMTIDDYGVIFVVPDDSLVDKLIRYYKTWKSIKDTNQKKAIETLITINLILKQLHPVFIEHDRLISYLNKNESLKSELNLLDTL